VHPFGRHYGFLELILFFFVIIPAFLIAHSWYVSHVLLADLVLYGFQDGVVLLCILRGLLSLPGIGPGAVEGSAGMGVGTGAQDPDILFQRKYPVSVLQQCNSF